ncbi:MAG: OFA family MFS transporter [bacterium]|nr:OFA family MFS transporter [bacterium]
MSSPRVMNRWWVVAGGILVQLCLGAIYAWSAFTGRLAGEPFGFSAVQGQWIFSASLLTFAVVMALVAGRWQAKAGPRVVTITGGLVLGLGYVVAGLSGASFWGILLGIGVLGGAGIGLAYVCPLAALVKWFPDRKGLITGLAVAGFGFGALIWIKLTQGFVFGPVRLTGDWGGLFGMGWSVHQVWMLYGVLFAALVSLGAIVLVDPPAGWRPKGWTPPTSIEVSGKREFTGRQMVRTPQFWGLFTTFLFGSVAGLMVIGCIERFGSDRLASSGLTAAETTVVAGTAMGLFYALFNGLGRILWGWISDGLGRRRSIILLSAVQGVMMIGFFWIGGSEWGLYLGAAIIGFNYGGNFALFPAATADLFGDRKVGTNYPYVFLSYGVGGIVGPLLGGIMKDLGTQSGDATTWIWAFVPAGIACLLGSVIMLALRAPRRLPRPAEQAEEPVRKAA